MAATVEVPKKPSESEGLAIAPLSPLSVMQQAISQGISIEILERLQDMYYRSEAEAARRAFTEAMSAFKAESIRIVKDRVNKQYNSRYTSIENLVNTVTPFLSKHGLSARWDIDQSAQTAIKVACVITHTLGHSESVSMTVPPDNSGQKNPIQQIKSSITYAKICTFESACGLASSDANVDDDGNSAGHSQGGSIPDERYVELMDNIKGSNNDMELQNSYQRAIAESKAVKDETAQRAFQKTKNDRYRSLHAAR